MLTRCITTGLECTAKGFGLYPLHNKLCQRFLSGYLHLTKVTVETEEANRLKKGESRARDISQEHNEIDQEGNVEGVGAGNGSEFEGDT